MAQTGRFAVYALLGEDAARRLRRFQLALANLTSDPSALSFPAHVTLRGRFTASWSTVASFQKEAAALRSGVFGCAWLGPLYVPPKMAWLEVPPGYDGHQRLSDLHCYFDCWATRVLTSDETPSAFAGMEYRPHLTLGWGVTQEVYGLFIELVKTLNGRGRIEHLALACYPDTWPAAGEVEILARVPLENS